jgi:hypothetical protein
MQRIRKRLMRRRFNHWRTSIVKLVRRRRALLWSRSYKVRFRTFSWLYSHRTALVVTVVAGLIAASVSGLPGLQQTLESCFNKEETLQTLRALLLALGGALVGATAIVSSLVLFSMQVNIERMPHGLFMRLSTDLRLLSAFAAAFLLAVTVAVLSLMPDVRFVGAAVLVATWATTLTLGLFLYGYRRALFLINPLRQIDLVVSDVAYHFRIWLKRANRAAPLLAGDGDRMIEVMESHFDLSRASYFRLNPHWTDGAKRGVQYAVSYARRYAEQGDHEVSAFAMEAVASINEAYVETKGRTFFAQQLLLENPLVTDAFINECLECLRQTVRIAVSRGDERQIEKSLETIGRLVCAYARIDYGRPDSPRTHAHLAASYLTGEIERIIPHNLPDVLMEGARLNGKCATQLLFAEGPLGASTLIDKLGILGCCGVAKSDYRPVTHTCMEQLGRLSLSILRSRRGEVKFAFARLRSSVALITKTFLTVSDDPLSQTHSRFLAPYYSAVDGTSFVSALTNVVNVICSADADNADAQLLVTNIEKWADGLYRSDQEIFLEALARRSSFTFDMIYWLTHVSQILICVSTAPACNERDTIKLQRHALSLISILDRVPADDETVALVENSRLTERLFEVAAHAYKFGAADVAQRISDLLVSWMFKSAQNQAGWNTLERSICGLAVLALMGEAARTLPHLKAELGAKLSAGALSEVELRDGAARSIRGTAQTLYRGAHMGSSIERAMAQTDREQLEALLDELANILSPDTAGEATEVGLV